MSTYTKRSSKKALSVMCSKHTALQVILLDVFHRVATGKAYNVDYKRKDSVNSAPEAPKAETSKPKAKAAKTTKTEEVKVSKTKAA